MKKFLIVAVLCAFVCTMITACGSEQAETGGEECSAVTENVIAAFTELAKVPRPSHFEDQISNYLMNWAEENGFEAVQDDVFNLVIDVPPSEGMEDKPTVCLQCHMDMVFAQEKGLDLDPLETGVVVKNDGTYLTSDGKTSLGADNGIGLAIAMKIAEGEIKHGPLRLIFTTDEEDESVGVFNLDPASVKNISYLINIDNEIEGSACLSSAGIIKEEFSFEVTSEEPSYDASLEISLNKLSGGHSGVEIDKGRLNGLICIANMLLTLEKNGVSYELASLSGGTVLNAIPADASAVICLAQKDVEKAEKVINGEAEKYKADYSETDPEMTVDVKKTDIPKKVLSGKDKDRTIRFLSEIRDGLYTMMDGLDGVIESSSNIGVCKIDENGMSAEGSIRSAAQEKLDFLFNDHKKLAESLGIELADEKVSDYWPYKADNPLYEYANSAYKSLFGKEMEVYISHGGLECGAFFLMNPEINMISVGPNITDGHTVNEKVEIASIEKTWRLIQKILEDIE